MILNKVKLYVFLIILSYCGVHCVSARVDVQPLTNSSIGSQLDLQFHSNTNLYCVLLGI